MNQESGFIFNLLFSLWSWFSIRVLFFSLLWLLLFFFVKPNVSWFHLDNLKCTVCLESQTTQKVLQSCMTCPDDTHAHHGSFLEVLRKCHSLLWLITMSHLNFTWRLNGIGDPKSWWEAWEPPLCICLVSLKWRAVRGTVCPYSKELKKTHKVTTHLLFQKSNKCFVLVSVLRNWVVVVEGSTPCCHHPFPITYGIWGSLLLWFSFSNLKSVKEMFFWVPHT